jgi:hypothetical protein
MFLRNEGKQAHKKREAGELFINDMWAALPVAMVPLSCLTAGGTRR